MISMVIILTTPFHDIGHGTYIIMFVFLVMAYGIYSFLIRIPWTIVRQIAVVSLLWTLALQEYPIYEREFWTIHGSYIVGGCIALYDMKVSKISSKDIVFFPGGGVEATEGGFEGETFNNGFQKREYSYLSPSIRCFRSLEGLRRGMESLITTPKHGSIIAYLSTSVSPKELDDALWGLDYQCYEVSYFEREWHGKVSVYKLVSRF